MPKRKHGGIKKVGGSKKRERDNNGVKEQGLMILNWDHGRKG